MSKFKILCLTPEDYFDLEDPDIVDERKLVTFDFEGTREEMLEEVRKIVLKFKISEEIGELLYKLSEKSGKYKAMYKRLGGYSETFFVLRVLQDLELTAGDYDPDNSIEKKAKEIAHNRWEKVEGELKAAQKPPGEEERKEARRKQYEKLKLEFGG